MGESLRDRSRHGSAGEREARSRPPLRVADAAGDVASATRGLFVDWVELAVEKLRARSVRMIPLAIGALALLAGWLGVVLGAGAWALRAWSFEAVALTIGGLHLALGAGVIAVAMRLAASRWDAEEP